MSEPAAFAIVRDGQRRFYADRWASVYFLRELVWGPDAFEAWVTQLEEIDEWYDDFASAAVVDFDKRCLMWTNGDDRLVVPKVAALYQRLLTAAWPGYQIDWRIQSSDLSEALGITPEKHTDEDDEPDQQDTEADLHPALRGRPATVAEACAQNYDDDEVDDLEDDEETDQQPHRTPRLPSALGDAPPSDPSDLEVDSDAMETSQPVFDDEELRAWITITAASGAIRHRQLASLPRDLLQGDAQALAQLSKLAPCEVPPEELVSEGMWIEENERTIGFWGNPHSQHLLPIIEKGWPGWDVYWAPRGYTQHCTATGPSGQLLSIEAGLAKFMPVVLSTQRFNISTVVGALGGSLKKTAMKGTGCLLLVVCSPLLIFGAVSGNWKAVLITVGIVIALTVIGFKVVERRIKRSFKNSFVDREEAGRTAPPTAGPLEPAARRQAVEKLLAAAGLPPLNKIEPLFPEKNELNLP